jgi:SAM-dependent methyltransferase
MALACARSQEWNLVVCTCEGTHVLAASDVVRCNVCCAGFPADTATLFVKDGHTIVRCPSCKLVFRADLPTPDDVAPLYERDYFIAAEGSLGSEGYLDYVGDEDAHRANARRRLGRIAGIVTPGALLDVGSAAGFFVSEALRAGWNARGIDISAEMVSWGVERLGVDLARTSFADEPSGRIESCITMWDYLEHARDPRADVERAFAQLRPGGVLALSTGDVGSLLARVAPRRWHLLTPRHHNYFFSTATMRRLLTSVGFDVLSVDHPASVFPLRYLAHKGGIVLDVSIVHDVSRRLAGSRAGSWVVPVNLWDVMTVIARRPATAKAVPGA